MAVESHTMSGDGVRANPKTAAWAAPGARTFSHPLVSMKIGLAQINTTVGDLSGNRRLILEAYKELCASGAELVVFPEMAVAGYPPRDLLNKSRFVVEVEAAVRQIAASVGAVPAVIGFVERNGGPGRPFYNAAAWCENGEIREIARKCLLPSYDVFDEDRYFQPASHPVVVTFRGRRVGLTICEDIWTSHFLPTRARYNVVPIESFPGGKVDLLLNLSASPWQKGKGELRETILRDAARHLQCPVVYCNLVGGNDELIFDGRSVVMSPYGETLAQLPPFQSARAVVELASAPTAPVATRPQMQEVYDALVLGLRDYAVKTGFKKALIGLSGGIDSALVGTLAAAALGPENVFGISLPSNISSQHSKDDAATLAKNLGIHYHTMAIQAVVESARAVLEPVFHEMGLPALHAGQFDLTAENLQARSRGLLLMAVSNKIGALLLTTGNKSEMAVGYCTLYGDMAGGLSVISDLYKTEVYALAQFINRDRIIIPQSSIDKPPSAELRPNQKDQDTLPPYDLLDAILERYIEQGQSSAEIIGAGFPEHLVRDTVRRVDLNEYKRKQAAPGLKLTPLAFGVGRRIPIVQKYVS